MTARKMPHRTFLHAEEGERFHLFQGMLVQLLNTLRNAAIVRMGMLSSAGG